MTTALLDDVGQLDFVDEDGSYDVTLLLGPNRSYGACRPGTWERVPENDEKDEQGRVTGKAYRAVLAEHKIGPLRGRTVNGLISASNDWLRENATPYVDVGPGLHGRWGGRRIRREASINHCLAVASVSPSDELPNDMTRQERLESLLERLVEAVEKTNDD